MELQGIHRFEELVRKAGKIVITSHKSPDGDALGSSGALYHYFKGKGRDVSVVLDDTVPDTLSFIYEGIPVCGPEAFGFCDLIVCTDFNLVSRAGGIEEDIRRCGAPKILIDHHVGPETDAFDLVFSDPSMSSASEFVYRILREVEGGPGTLAPDVCRCLMAGMTTDTNNFANSVTAGTLRMAAELLEAGVDREDILSRLYNSYRPNRVAAFGYLLDRELRISEDGLAYIVISDALWHRFGLREGELEGLVNVPLTIADVKISVTLRESPEDGYFRVSVRSREGYSARKLAAGFFHGGGHEKASGGRLYFPGDIASSRDVHDFMKKLKI